MTFKSYRACAPCLKSQGLGEGVPKSLEFEDNIYRAGVCELCEEITLVCSAGLWEDDDD
jgi:hypothetical protein